MGILAWIVLGLIAGAIAKLILPGKQPGGIIVTIIIGIVGGLLGGWLGSLLFNEPVDGLNLGSILLAVGGAIIVLLVYGAITGRRGSRA
ncbi:GlsB/YeaQ/YmgE family stress response membrane protein [Homoserinibacter sp. YIM 151385]|uniref:GlsB/YeaQ/YmgE family stress response membrane protein n=1 Tax=Homoserinibacter sp. YIM 151385 TaxID=2985506 RepID=UPI0022F06F8F|nr:GlsB/YeaQ/YmgE family stress response membrane protein [Homoserinibacter sp. YIM 151385]WBU38566.1 GlsB/YeaQ/YmgE family stress response membrane protein [Homoserinibacter sp. YIM 151385]